MRLMPCLRIQPDPSEETQNWAAVTFPGKSPVDRLPCPWPWRTSAYWEAPDVKSQGCVHLLNESWNQLKPWCNLALEHVLSGLKWATAFQANQLPPRKYYTDINLPEPKQNTDNVPEVYVHRKLQTHICITSLIKRCTLSTSLSLLKINVTNKNKGKTSNW